MPDVLNPSFPPSIFIGLGGAGTETVARLKRHLLRLQADGLPINIDKMAFVCFDIESLGGHSSVACEELKPGESFISTSGFLPSQYVDRHYDNTDIQFWWDTRMNRICRTIDAFDAAKTHRQLGRLALYACQDEVRASINKAVSKASDATKDGPSADPNTAQTPPQVYVISGTCGGTGSGSFLDASVIAYEEAYSAFGSPPEMTAMLVLPDFYIARDPNNKQRFQANAYAFFEELEYFSLDPAAFRDYCMCPSRYKAEGGYQFPQNWVPGKWCFVLDQHISKEDSLNTPQDFLDYLGEVALNRYIAGIWETSNHGWENCDFLMEQDKWGRVTHFSSAGLRKMAYPTEVVMKYLDAKLIIHMLDYALQKPEQTQLTKSVAAAEEQLAGDFRAAKKMIEQASVKRQVVPPPDKDFNANKAFAALRAAWTSAKERIDYDCLQLREDLDSRFAGIESKIEAVLAEIMTQCGGGYKATDAVLDTVADNLRLMLLGFKKLRDEASHLWQQSQAYLVGSGGAGSVLDSVPKKAKDARLVVNTARGHISSYYRNRMLDIGYGALYDHLSKVVGETKDQINNVMGRHDVYRNETFGKLSERLDYWKKNGVQQSDLIRLLNDKITTYCPTFKEISELEKDKRITEIVGAAQLDDPKKTEERWRDILAEWASDSSAAVHLSDVAKTSAVVDELVSRLRKRAKQELGGTKLPGIREALEMAGRSLADEVRALKSSTSLMCRESYAQKQMNSKTKSVLIIDEAGKEIDTVLSDLGMAPVYVKTSPEAFTTLSICHGFPITSLQKHTEWIAAFDSVIAEDRMPHIDKDWNRTGGVRKVNGSQPSSALGERVIKSFVQGRFLQWVLDQRNSANRKVSEEIVEAVHKLFQQDRRKRIKGNSGAASWVHRVSDSTEQLPGYYAVNFDGDEHEGFRVTRWTMLAETLTDALAAYKLHPDIVDHSETFMQILLYRLGAKRVQSMGDKFIEEMEKQLKSVKGVKTREVLQKLMKAFTTWVDGLVVEESDGTGDILLSELKEYAGPV